MGLIDKLKKANIVRVGGVAGTYKSAKDRPMSLQDDMFIGRDKDAESSKKGKSLKQRSSYKLSKFVLVACCILALVFISLALTTTMAWLFIVIWLLVSTYFLLVYLGKLTFQLDISWTLLLVIIAIVSFIAVLLTQSDPDSSVSDKTSNSSNKALTSQQCQPYVDTYNEKTYNISSDGLQGTLAIKIDNTSGCKLRGWYHVLLSHNLPANNYSRDIGEPAYNYIVLLRPNQTDARTQYDGYGALSPAYQNVTQLPEAFAESRSISNFYSSSSRQNGTRYFYWHYTIDTDFSEQRYQQLFQDTTLQIVDGLNYIEESNTSDGGVSRSINEDKAAVEGPIAKSYTLTIEPQ